MRQSAGSDLSRSRVWCWVAGRCHLLSTHKTLDDLFTIPTKNH